MNKMITGTDNAKEAELHLRGLIAKCTPKYRALARSVRSALRRRFPTAEELVYDYPGNLMIAYSPTERGSDAVVAFATRATGLALYFAYGSALPDPKKLLRGSGKLNRFIPLDSVKVLSQPDVRALIAAAVNQAKIPLRETGKGRLIIKPGSPSKKPKRRPQK